MSTLEVTPEQAALLLELLSKAAIPIPLHKMAGELYEQVLAIAPKPG